MEAAVDSEAKGCTFLWKIVNLDSWNWLPAFIRIFSPDFIADALQNTKWEMMVSKSRYYYTFNLMYLGCEGPNEIAVFYYLSFLDLLGSASDKEKFFYVFPKDQYPYEIAERPIGMFKSFFSSDDLILQCSLWNTDEEPQMRKSNLFFATTAIDVKRRDFLWEIDKPLDLKVDIENEFRDYLISFRLKLRKDLKKMFIDSICTDQSVEYVSLNVSIIATGERKERQKKFKHFDVLVAEEQHSFIYSISSETLANPSWYFPNQVLSLCLEFVLLTFEKSECKKYSDALDKSVVSYRRALYTKVPNEDLNYRYDDDASKDFTLKFSKNEFEREFRVNREVLTASSNYFQTLLKESNEEIRNSETEAMVPEIFEDDLDIVEEMLKYIYNGSLEKMSCVKACKLLKISNYYDIPSLNSFCSSFIQDRLSVENACRILILADEQVDDDLKIAAQNFILSRHKQILLSQKWKNLMKSHHKLAADVLYRKMIESYL